MSSYPQESFRNTTFSPSSFWSKRRAIVRKNTLHTQLQILKSTGRYDAFKLKWHPAYEDGHKALFWDSDVAKWLEGACYFLEDEDDNVIDHAVKELVEMISGAQWKDGYLNLFFTVVKPGERFTNLRDMHELYNAGHLIEAALAHQQHYHNNLLLEPMLKYLSLIHATFGPGPDQIHGYPGHPEMELALLRLHHRTGNKKAYDLAKYFITERGNPKGVQGKPFYLHVAQKRGESPSYRPDSWPTADSSWYLQAHKPVLEQGSVEGHSVRAMYLLTAVADLVRMGNDKEFGEYKLACERLWNNMVDKKMYLTGGIGAVDQWEGFGIDYFLPQSTDEGGCYAETCASIGILMFAQRMLQLDLNSKYADILELALYNTVLGSMSADGKSFLYENHLASCDARPAKREQWFDCACCPPNLTRTLGMLGGVAINVHLYTAATLVEGNVKLEQETNYPWGGTILFTLTAPPSVDVTVNLRIPGWVKPFQDGLLFRIHPTPSPPSLSFKKGYLTLPPSFTSATPKFQLSFSIPSFAPRFLTYNHATSQNTLTIARGPLIYCAEDFDNQRAADHFKSVRLSSSARFEERIIGEEGEGGDEVEGVGVVGVSVNGVRLRLREDGEGGVKGEDKEWEGKWPGFEIGSESELVKEDVEVLFVPYFWRGNRGGRGQMRVGFKRED